MKSSIAVVAVAALASAAEAAKCQNLTIPINVAARQGHFSQQTPVTNIDVTNFLLNLGQQGANYSQQVLQGYRTVAGNYSIAATYCTPDNGSPRTVQVLTHGIGFDRSYWDAPFNNYNYSYVRQAVDKYGYSTFSWDRLGIGMSSHGEPVNEIQAELEVAALAFLTKGIRAGSLPGISARPQRVVNVGHSFGSAHTYLMSAMYPNITDGIALTGFSQNGSFVADFLFGGNFVQANLNPALTSYSNGYLAAADASGVQTNFFSPGMFDPNILQFATTTGQPVTVGELLSFGGETGTMNTFAGPVLIVTGSRDIPYCGGNCLGTGGMNTSIPQMALKTFTNPRNPRAVLVPNAGHGLNFEYSHPFTYTTILQYFLANGLSP